MRIDIAFVAASLLSTGTMAAHNQTPEFKADGYTNPNARLERTYEKYPQEQIWYEFGRPYWKPGKVEVTAAPLKEIEVKNEVVKKIVADRDFDGVKNELDQCKNTPMGEKVNAFGCPVDKEVSIDLAVQFETGKSNVRPQFAGEVDKLAEILKENRDLRIEIGGHTDSTGSRRFNNLISNMRSKAVRNYLINQHGISAKRLEAKGYGPDQPLESNLDSLGREKNRRVEARIIK